MYVAVKTEDNDEHEETAYVHLPIRQPVMEYEEKYMSSCKEYSTLLFLPAYYMRLYLVLVALPVAHAYLSLLSRSTTADE